MIVPSVFIHQQSMVLETVTRFISASPQCFTEDDHPIRHSSSFNKQKLWGGMIAIYVTQVFVFITCIAVIFTFQWWFNGFVDLSSEVLCVDRSLYLKCFVFLFQFELKICFMYVVAASTSAASSLTPHFTPRKITTRTTARKCGIGMVSKLWLHFFFSWISLKLLSCV